MQDVWLGTLSMGQTKVMWFLPVFPLIPAASSSLLSPEKLTPPTPFHRGTLEWAPGVLQCGRGQHRQKTALLRCFGRLGTFSFYCQSVVHICQYLFEDGIWLMVQNTNLCLVSADACLRFTSRRTPGDWRTFGSSAKKPRMIPTPGARPRRLDSFKEIS